MIISLRADVIYGLTWAEGEELSNLTIQASASLIPLNIGKHLGVGHNQRLALPEEEQILVLLIFVEIFIDAHYRLVRP